MKADALEGSAGRDLGSTLGHCRADGIDVPVRSTFSDSLSWPDVPFAPVEYATVGCPGTPRIAAGDDRSQIRLAMRVGGSSLQRRRAGRA
jgi:hypothetical protein